MNPTIPNPEGGFREIFWFDGPIYNSVSYAFNDERWTSVSWSQSMMGANAFSMSWSSRGSKSRM
jgi:hypothetical protein